MESFECQTELNSMILLHKTDRTVRHIALSNKKKVTTGGTSGIILIKFRDLSKISPKMNWAMPLTRS